MTEPTEEFKQDIILDNNIKIKNSSLSGAFAVPVNGYFNKGYSSLTKRIHLFLKYEKTLIVQLKKLKVLPIGPAINFYYTFIKLNEELQASTVEFLIPGFKNTIAISPPNIILEKRTSKLENTFIK